MDPNEKRQREVPPPGWVDFDAAGPELTEEDEKILDKVWEQTKHVPVDESLFEDDDDEPTGNADQSP